MIARSRISDPTRLWPRKVSDGRNAAFTGPFIVQTRELVRINQVLGKRLTGLRCLLDRLQPDQAHRHQTR